MKDFFKYLTIGEADIEWGLSLTVAGRATVNKKSAYPVIGHPPSYSFRGSNGRVLEEFQLIYITEGSGDYNKAGIEHYVGTGTMMIIQPGEKHQYGPNPDVGWVENYVGFKGKLADHFFSNSGFFESPNIIRLGLREEVIEVYRQIFQLIKKEEPGFQQIASGLIIKLLGYLIAFQKQIDFEGKPIQKTVRQARAFLQENIDRDVDLKKFAADHFTAYSYFRKMFKRYTGVSPHQYYLDLKILRAKELILMGTKSMKEISFELGFDSLQYFSRLFKKKIGLNPTEWRKKYRGGG